MRGSVYRVNFPSKDARGNVQSNPRPAVVLSPDATYDRFDSVLVVPGTSNAKSLRFPHTTLIASKRGNGLAQDTVFLGFQVQVVPKSWMQPTILGVLEPADLAAVERVTREALGL